jgi:hypothetical protein
VLYVSFLVNFFFNCNDVTYIARYVEFVECMPRNTHYHWLGRLVCRAVGGGMNVQDKTPYNFNTKQICSQTKHFNATKQYDNVSVHRHVHLLPNFGNKCAC